MRTRLLAVPLVAALLMAASAHAQPPREDAFWARGLDGATITLDGVLDEPAWSAAEMKIIKYRYDSGMPGSGWKDEGGVPATDSLYAELRLLVDEVNNKFWLGVFVRDSSVGGGGDFNRFDGILMSLKNHAAVGAPAPPAEYLYSWWRQLPPPGPGSPGEEPYFGGEWSTAPWGSPRTQEQIDAWDARTTVHGLSNSDAVPDTGYTIEMVFDLTVMGYDVTQSEGDILEWNISIYDCDWQWPNTGRLSSNRTWWQGPWGNSAFYNEVRVHARPDVHINSGALPTLDPELIVPNASGFAPPTIDGALDESVWAQAPSFDIRYGDILLRETYPSVGPWRAGQFQPEVNGGQAAILNPGDATVKYFFKDNTLYLGFDVRDEVVQYHNEFDRWDGFVVTINDRVETTSDNTQEIQRLTFQVGETGEAIAHDYLPFLRDTLNGAEVAISLNSGTTVDTVGVQADSGYTAELSIDLTKLGYPNGLGDRIVFLGINLLDGDSYTPFTFSHATRTWWFREFQGSCCPVWAYLDPATGVVGVEDPIAGPIDGISLAGNAPNPFRTFTNIGFALSEPGQVTLDVYDLTGRRVARNELGLRQAGRQMTLFDGSGLRPGLYYYRLSVLDPVRQTVRMTAEGKMTLVE